MAPPDSPTTLERRLAGPPSHNAKAGRGGAGAGVGPLRRPPPPVSQLLPGGGRWDPEKRSWALGFSQLLTGQVRAVSESVPPSAGALTPTPAGLWESPGEGRAAVGDVAQMATEAPEGQPGQARGLECQARRARLSRRPRDLARLGS